MQTTSRYEKNLHLQPRRVADVLDSPRPAWMGTLRDRRPIFVGTGTSHHAAQVARWLWRRHVSPEAVASSSFDFVRTPQATSPRDVVVLFSHRGTKTFTVEAAGKARRAGATTVGITSRDSPWTEDLSYRVETCEAEDCGAHTKSLTSALARIVQWIDEPELHRAVLEACARIEAGPVFPDVGRGTDLVLVGDVVREWVAREVALKLQEAAWLRARPFGLEELLHGPRISVDGASLVVAFSDPSEGRWQAARDFFATTQVGLVPVEAPAAGVPEAAGWLWQLFWGQRLTLHVCRGLGVDPDLMRKDDPRYRLGFERL
ncbi:MAG: SIS domain-containing protein, partial [Planctomycetes bacterium]|nr:SIS domain-containing protein [Planctomycetota bacterium]